MEKKMMFIILSLIVAVAAFNIVSTLVMAVTDKQADIAILRTLGASPRSIMNIFIVQGVVIGLVGTLARLNRGEDANGKALPFRSGTFDKAVCFSALHHVPNMARALTEIARVLRPTVCPVERLMELQAAALDDA